MSAKARTVAVQGLFALSASLAAILLAEGLLRLAGVTVPPVAFLLPDGGDYRGQTAGGFDHRVSTTIPLLTWDAGRLWRLNPAVSTELSPEGLRLRPAPAEHPPRLVVAVGDSNTIGPLHEDHHWPGLLQDYAIASGEAGVRVLNAGCYGYTAFQGLDRLEDVLPLRPSIVLFSFGLNDARPARATDRERAARVTALRPWRHFRLAELGAYALWSLQGRTSGTPGTFRVPLAEYREHLVAFVDRVRAAGATPVLLTRPYHGRSQDPASWLRRAPLYAQATRDVAASRGVLLVDAFREFETAVDLFVDASHFNRAGNERMAELVLRGLRTAGLLEEVRLPPYGREVDAGRPGPPPREIGPGFWPAEEWSGGRRGRWTAAEATVRLEPSPGDTRLEIDATFQNPAGVTTGRVAVNGTMKGAFSEANRREALSFEAGEATGPVEVELRVENAFVPREIDARNRDERRLGVFVHRVGFVKAPGGTGSRR